MTGWIFIITTLIWIASSLISRNPLVMGLGAMIWIMVLFWIIRVDSRKLGINKNKGKNKWDIKGISKKQQKGLSRALG